ncbi:MAG: acetylhydrolase [Chlorobi bacterium]|nr:acetylhydrolase [Chlorobiota bacterium]
MKQILTYIFLFIIPLSYGQTHTGNTVSSFSEQLFKYNSSNYVEELSKDMDTAFFSRYEDEIIEFEKEDSVNGIKKGKILFVGSSSFRKWTSMKTDLFPVPVLNRGFGGSTMPELDYYFFKIVKPCKPKAVVVYEGDNDVLAPFLTAEVILKSFKIFTDLTKQYLPGTKIFFVSIKPSPSRISYLEKMKKTNKLIRDFCNSDNTLNYIDITKPMFNSSGNIREDIFRKDRLHMNEKGYKIWAEIIKAELLKNL